MLYRTDFDENGRKTLCQMGGVNADMLMDIFVQKLAPGDTLTLEEAEKAAQGYVDGTMEDDGFKYDGAAVYDQQEHKCIRIYGDYPDEKAHAQVRASAEPEQQEPEHFIDHFYVAEDIQKRGALDIKEYSSFDDALRAYYALPDTQRKALGAMNTRDLPGLSLIHISEPTRH